MFEAAVVITLLGVLGYSGYRAIRTRAKSRGRILPMEIDRDGRHPNDR